MTVATLETGTMRESKIPASASDTFGAISSLVERYHTALQGGLIAEISITLEEMESLVQSVCIREDWHEQGEASDYHEFAIKFKGDHTDGWELTLMGYLHDGEPTQRNIKMGYALLYEIEEPFGLSYCEYRTLEDFVTALYRGEFLGGGR